MARALIITLPAHGHVNPTLPLAQELIAHGEEVIYCLPEQYQATIQPTRAALLPYKITGRDFRWSGAPCAELLLWLPLHAAVASLEVLPHLLEKVATAQPDYIIYDAWCLWGRLLAHILHLPAIRCQPTFVMNEQLGQTFWTMLAQADRLAMPRRSAIESPLNFGAALEELRSTYHVPVIDLKSFFDHAEALNIVPIPRTFQPGGETFDDRFQFVGPSLRPHDQGTDFPLDRLNKQPMLPTLYISLGTVCQEEAAFYQMCFAAFGEGSRVTDGKGLFSRTAKQAHQPHWQVVLATGKSDLSILSMPPENFLVSPRVPQLAVLQHSSVFLTHGGMNSVMEALSYGVPLVVIPQMLEQGITARRVEELGLGIALESDALTPDLLQEAVMQVSSNRAIHTRMQQMRETLRQMGGARRAAEAIIQFSRTTGQRLWSWTPLAKG